MRDFPPWELPEVMVSDAKVTRLFSRAVKSGKLRRIGPRLYSSNLTDAPEKIVRRNIWRIVDNMAPGGLIADRTALELKPAADGSIFLISPRRRDLVLPGLVIRSRKGSSALPDDKPFGDYLRLSSTARAFLENLKPSRSRRGAAPRTLPLAEIEERLDGLLRRSGEGALQRLRDDARRLAPQLDLQREFEKLDALIGMMLGTREVSPASKVTLARKMGEPYDPARLRLFETLHGALREWSPSVISGDKRLEALAFFEAYFSNFIEGTEFAVSEAEEIVFEGKLPVERPADAHDILGTYRMVSDAGTLKRLPRRYEEFLSLLKERHALIMSGRPEALPGRFKEVQNRAGSTVFVAPELVTGTLKEGFDLYRSLEAPFQRAVFMMFLVAEVHPFADGNGRLARIMMNAELVAGGEARIIIPTVFRNNYLAALKALTHSGLPEPLIRSLDFAQRYTAKVDWRDREISRRILEATHAFVDPAEADSQGIRLTMPDDVLIAEIMAGRREI